MRRITIALTACLLLLGAGLARADDGSRDLAKRHFAQGEEKYKAGDYRGAIAEFLAADALVPSPILSYNVALCHEKLGEKEQALRLYRDYLARRPDAPNRKEVEGRIAALEAPAAAAPEAEPYKPLDAPPPAAAPKAGPAEQAPPGASPQGQGYDDLLARRIPDRSAAPEAAPAPAPEAAPAPAPEAAPGAAPAPMASRLPEQPAYPPAAPPQAPAPADKPAYKQWWFWVVVGVSAVILIDIAASSGSDSSSSTGVVLLHF